MIEPASRLSECAAGATAAYAHWQRGCYHDIMQQLTLRVESDLADALKRSAAARRESVNSFATAVLNAAVDPSFAGDEVSELRERLDRAGLLAHVAIDDGRPPGDAALIRARRQAGKGRSLASFVVEDRR
jgi:hypothetical protein